MVRQVKEVSAFEASILAVNSLIVAVYVAMLLVMCKQLAMMREQLGVMNGQQRVMQRQLDEMQSTRISAHRPVIAPFMEHVPLPGDELVFLVKGIAFRLANIGAGPALDIQVIWHEGAEPVYALPLPPIAAGDKSQPFAGYLRLSLTVTYTDIFGNAYWTVYEPETDAYTLGEGRPTHVNA